MIDLGPVVRVLPHKKMPALGYVLGGIATLIGAAILVASVVSLFDRSAKVGDLVAAMFAGAIFFVPGFFGTRAAWRKAHANAVYTLHEKGLGLKSRYEDKQWVWADFGSLHGQTTILRTNGVVTATTHTFVLWSRNKERVELCSADSEGVEASTGAWLSEKTGLPLRQGAA